MESLKNTSWDVLISGTGLPQSLLALALSRSQKKVLHVDKNDYYGGSEAALSLQEAELWVEAVNAEPNLGPYHHASIQKPSQDSSTTAATLGFSRAYSLSLAPQLIYSRSNLLPALVSSKVYRQLEFLAMGSWYIFKDASETAHTGTDLSSPSAEGQRSQLYKIPGGREDVFADKSIDLRSARSLMKFLKVAADVDGHSQIFSEWGSRPVSDYLSSEVRISPELQSLLLALTLSPNAPTETTTAFAIPRIHRHLTSIGMFGPGFGSVVPKWGGLAEVAQVACRAGAVGGGVYVLHRAINSISKAKASSEGDDPSNGEHVVQRDKTVGGPTETPTQESSVSSGDAAAPTFDVQLDNEEVIRTPWIVGTWNHLPLNLTGPVNEAPIRVERSISVISSPLSELFPAQVEGSPSLDAAVIVFPAGSLNQNLHPPVYLMVHTSGTGECPAGQCIVYSYTTSASPTSDCSALLSQAIDAFLSNIRETPRPEVLWSLSYQHDAQNHAISEQTDDHIICMDDIPPELVLEDDVLGNVREIWERIVGDEAEDGFMIFKDREGIEDDDPEQSDPFS